MEGLGVYGELRLVSFDSFAPLRIDLEPRNGGLQTARSTGGTDQGQILTVALLQLAAGHWRSGWWLAGIAG